MNLETYEQTLNQVSAATAIHEVLSLDLDQNPRNLSPKQIAAHLNVSLSALYKWTEPPDGSGMNFPSQRILEWINTTGSIRLIAWLNLQTNIAAWPIPEEKPNRKQIAAWIRSHAKGFLSILEGLSRILERGGTLSQRSVTQYDNQVRQYIALLQAGNAGIRKIYEEQQRAKQPTQQELF